MTFKNALLEARDAPGARQVLLGTAGGFVLRGDIEGAIEKDSDVIAFKVDPAGVSGSVERSNGSTIAIPTGRLLIPISSIVWISRGSPETTRPVLPDPSHD